MTEMTKPSRHDSASPVATAAREPRTDKALPEDWDDFTEGAKRSYVEQMHRRHREYEQALVERAERAERREAEAVAADRAALAAKVAGLKPGTICKCGLAQSYHPRFAKHEYEPRYDSCELFRAAVLALLSQPTQEEAPK